MTNPYTRGLAAHRAVCAYCTTGQTCAQADRMTRQEADYATEMATKTVTLSKDAADTIGDMQSRVAQIANLFGTDSPEHTAAARSLADVLSKIMVRGFGNADVSRDGQLSLFVREEGFVYGVIFFRDRGAAARMLTRHGHDPADPANAQMLAQFEDVAGTWSTHS